MSGLFQKISETKARLKEQNLAKAKAQTSTAANELASLKAERAVLNKRNATAEALKNEKKAVFKARNPVLMRAIERAKERNAGNQSGNIFTQGQGNPFTGQTNGAAHFTQSNGSSPFAGAQHFNKVKRESSPFFALPEQRATKKKK